MRGCNFAFSSDSVVDVKYKTFPLANTELPLVPKLSNNRPDLESNRNT